jgi:hypothetical protein
LRNEFVFIGDFIAIRAWLIPNRWIPFLLPRLRSFGLPFGVMKRGQTPLSATGAGLSQPARAVGRLFGTAAAGRGFLDGLFDRLSGFAGALLNAAQQLIVSAFGALEIVIRKLRPLLFQFALGYVPVALDF